MACCWAQRPVHDNNQLIFAEVENIAQVFSLLYFSNKCQYAGVIMKQTMQDNNQCGSAVQFSPGIDANFTSYYYYYSQKVASRLLIQKVTTTTSSNINNTYE